MLLYYSALTSVPISSNRSDYFGRFGEQELKRIKEFRRFFGQQAVIIGGAHIPPQEEVKADIARHKIIFNPNVVKMTAYGELMDYCVDVWGNAVKRALQIPDNNYAIAPELSMDEQRERLVINQFNTLTGFQRRVMGAKQFRYGFNLGA